uniref:F-box domain-containing protein n=1 Tax=Schizophyllum commune (strain H4-8 / FGSC 9210) TaxID=578458 RepID=D8Q104_SCHCM
MGDWDFVCALCAAPFSAASFEEPEEDEEEDGVNRSLLPKAAIAWLERLCVVGENEDAVGVGRCYISGPGKEEMYGSVGVAPGDHPNAPAAEGDDVNISVYYNYADDSLGAIPMHTKCLDILKKVLQRDGYELSADTLYASFLEVHEEGMCCLALDYYDFDGLTDQYFSLEAGQEAFVCDPIVIFQLEEYLDGLPTLKPTDGLAKSESNKFVSRMQDPFSLLPPEIILAIMYLIPRESFIPFLLASPTARRIELSNSFFHARMAIDMPWAWELIEGPHSRRMDIDWRAVYVHLRTESSAHRANAIPGLANRRRIWDVCGQAARIYERRAEEEKKATEQVYVPEDIKARATCSHVPHVLSPVPTKAAALTVWLPVTASLMGNEKKVRLFWTAKGVLSSITFEFNLGSGEEKVLFGSGQGVKVDECTIEAGDWIDGFEFSIKKFEANEGGSGGKENDASGDEDEDEDEDNEDENEDNEDEDDKDDDEDDEDGEEDEDGGEVEDDASNNEDDASNDEDEASDDEDNVNDEEGSTSGTENSDSDDEDGASDKRESGLAIMGVIVRRLVGESVVFGNMSGHRRLSVVQEGHTFVGLRGEASNGVISRVGLLELPELLGPQRRSAPDTSVPAAPLACHPSRFGYWGVQEASDLVPFYPLYFGRTENELAALTGIAVGSNSLGIAVYHDRRVSMSAGKLEEGFTKYFPIDGKGGERVIGFTVTMGPLVDGFKLVTNRGRQAISGRTGMNADSVTSTPSNPCVLAGLYCSYEYRSEDDNRLSSVSVLVSPGSSETADFDYFVRDQCMWEPSPPPATWCPSTPAFGAFADDKYAVFLDLSKPVREIKGLLAAPDWVDVVELGGFVIRYADGTDVYVGLPSSIWSQLDDDEPLKELPRHQHMSTSLGPMKPPELPAHVKGDEEVRAQNKDGAVWRLGEEGDRIAKVVVWETGSGRIDGLQFHSETGKASLRWGKCGSKPAGEVGAGDGNCHFSLSSSMALASIKPDLDELFRAITKVDEMREGGDLVANDPRVRPHLSRVRSIVRNQRPLQKLYSIDYERDIPYRAFLSDIFNYGIYESLVDAHFCVARLCSLSHTFANPDLCPFDVGFFVSFFDWIDHLLPIGREREILAFASAGRLPDGYVMECLESILYATLEILQYLSRERLREIVLSPEQRLSTFLVHVWMNWPRLSALLAEIPPKMVEACVLGFPMLYTVLNDHDARQAAFSAMPPEIRNNPRRFYDRCARHVRATIVPSEPNGEIFMSNHFRTLIPFTKIPGFRQPSKKLLIALMEYLRDPEHLVPLHWREVWVGLVSLCLPAQQAHRWLVEYGLFECIVRVRLTDHAAPMLDSMTAALRRAITSRRALRGFRNSYRKFTKSGVYPPYHALDEEDEFTRTTFNSCEAALIEADSEWKRAAICCNAACPAGGGGDKPLRACFSYFYDAQLEAHQRPGDLQARELLHLVKIATGTFSENYDLFMSIRPDEEIYVQIDLRPLLSGNPISANSIPLDDDRKRRIESDPWYTPFKVFDVEVYFMHEGKSCMRLMQFMNEELAGHIRMPFRSLTQPFFDDGATFDEWPEPYWRTERERLFGRNPDSPDAVDN